MHLKYYVFEVPASNVSYVKAMLCKFVSQTFSHFSLGYDMIPIKLVFILKITYQMVLQKIQIR